MREAIITDVDGLYTGVTLVEDNIIGVKPLYVDEILIGYQVAIPVPEGLHLPKWDMKGEVWIEGKSFDLIQYKQDKINALNEQCNQTVLGIFTSSAMGSEHTYVFDMEAQMNFAGAKQAFQDSLITNIDWNTKDTGVLNHTKAQFSQLWLDGFTHKITTIGKFRTLVSSVIAATSKFEVDAIID